MKEVGHFDILKRMSEENLDIRLAPLENVTYLRKVKAGTQVTIGVAGNVVHAIGVEGKFVGGLILADKEQYFETKKRMEKEE
jgi:hypothetical protein